MNKDKLELYETLIRASLALLFIVALTVAALGVIAISQMFMRQTISAPNLSVSQPYNRRA
jgi:hypothetical protein